MKKGNKGVKILIVEDSPTQAERLKYLLETNGHIVTIAGGGKEALSILHSEKPALIISDIMMPEMDGYQLCKEIKADEKLKDIPVMLLTALSDAKDVLRGLECNADNFITKPYDEKYLLSRIHYILINRELRKSEKMQIGVEVFFSGQKFVITSERQQILDLLLSTYETAVQQNIELARIRDELKALNEQLEQKVEDRTAMLQVEIDERKRAEVDVRKSNRALKMLSGCNEVLVRAEKEPELLRDICRIITEVGRYRLAWVGFAESDEEKTVRPVGQSGFDEGYLDRVKITWADTELGRGPTGKAIRTGKPYIVSNIQTDIDYLPWRDEALKHGYASTIAFPLMNEGPVFGALIIYASEPDAFHGEEVKILSELASDLSYGILTLRTCEERGRAQKEIKKRVKELEEFYNIAIGRELRMKELKDEIEELKEELSKCKKNSSGER